MESNSTLHGWYSLAALGTKLEFSVIGLQFCCVAFSFPPTEEQDRENSAQIRLTPFWTWDAPEVQSRTCEVGAVP